ncbi:ammonium transporter [Pseudoxanthomonas sp. JBR18]|uniref:ammonium transporter n=1 Tax=Pseudoxanthomonas sp. JBR18 TaxID=2969308 RepID=UPI002305548D|nr:ammonium transporter [Pseudoxanthomonas sp. JBR18]WCE06093.1 ammonium transporter [Pseudoxanthomonas sp. JBR18]
MKTRLLSGLKTRLQVLCLAAVCGVVVAGSAFSAAAQDTSAPATTEAPAADASAATAPEPVAAPAAEAPAEAAPEAAAPTVDKGDVAWMLTSTLLVLLMTVPGLALFYGGMVRAKNVLSVLIQVITVFSLIAILWVVYGYSLAFDGGNAWIGTTGKVFLKGVTGDSLADTFTEAVKLPEYVFIVFQLTFAGITGALIVGAFAERVKFAAVLLFSVIWFTFGYIPLAHMVWGAGGFLLEKGALDFAGGTVVHINAGVAGLVGSYFVGKRLGFGQSALKPHNVTLTFVGASLLWVGWFGFNAGSNLEATSGAALAFLNTMLATAAAVLAWALAEKVLKGKSSALGVASGAVAGLVGITPACGTVGPFGAIAIGAIAAVICVWGVTGLKKLLGADDSLDVFGVHGIGGIVGAILTGVFTAPGLGGTGAADFSIGGQVATQALGVGITIVWIGIVSIVGFLIAKLVFGLRVSEEAEREGLDITSHGESAYEA